MAAIMVNAASMAYRKAAANTRRATALNPEIPEWLRQIAEKTEDRERGAAHKVIIEPSDHRKKRLFSTSNLKYEQFAWIIHSNIASKGWFEFFIIFNIVLVGITTGLDLENHGRDEWTSIFSNYVTNITLTVFTFECMIKLISEGYEPWRYFTDYELGYYNTFDFLIVLLSIIFIETGGGAISALRMMRLIRLLTFIKYVPELRVLVGGLFEGVKSVVYICILLFLVIYIFAILGSLLFGANDPAHFGDVSIAMLTLFQVSTQASWTSIAYVSWFGCEDYLGSPYGDEHPSRINTNYGKFEGFRCDVNQQESLITGGFFAFYILITSWVIMSLFIGVISMGMFATYITLKEEERSKAYASHHAMNTMTANAAKQALIHKTGSSSSSSSRSFTLKDRMDIVLNDQAFDMIKNESSSSSFILNIFKKLINNMKKLRDSNIFIGIITITILIVGITTGVETNQSLSCLRMEDRIQDKHHDSDDDVFFTKQYYEELVENCNKQSLELFFIGFVSQIVFTIEAIVKIIAEGTKPWQYFNDKDNGPWNCVDFFIVVVGFLEYTPASYIFEDFPIVLLRLIRLLRVFRLAKTLPRLRSIVEALVTGFSSVGWICILFAVFNYIVACMCIIVFQENDQFHFGSIGRAMFTVFRIETLDSWDQILYISMYGCSNYPGGYEFLLLNGHHLKDTCHEKNSNSFGWLGTFILFIITIIGAYILPVVLIGVVSIKFDEATRYIKALEENKKEIDQSLVAAETLVPGFFTEERILMMETVFDLLDSSKSKSLDMQEAAPFFHYSLASLFNVEITSKQYESIFYLVDMDLTSAVGMGEFIIFTAVIKDMEKKCCQNKTFALEKLGEKSAHYVWNKNEYAMKHYQSDIEETKLAMNNKEKNIKQKVNNNDNNNNNNNDNNDVDNMNEIVPIRKYSKKLSSFSHGISISKSNELWDRSMSIVNAELLKEAWTAILRTINSVEDVYGTTLSDKIYHLFKDVDSDGTGDLDFVEFATGLEKCGIYLSKEHVNSLANSMDIDGDGSISFEEFTIQVQSIKVERENEKDKEDYDKMVIAIQKRDQRDELIKTMKKKEMEIINHQQNNNKTLTTFQKRGIKKNNISNSASSGSINKRKSSVKANDIQNMTLKTRNEKLSEIKHLLDEKAKLGQMIKKTKLEIRKYEPKKTSSLSANLRSSSLTNSLKDPLHLRQGSLTVTGTLSVMKVFKQHSSSSTKKKNKYVIDDDNLIHNGKEEVTSKQDDVLPDGVTDNLPLSEFTSSFGKMGTSV